MVLKAPFYVFGGLIGDVQQRLCTASEIKFYSVSLLEATDESGTAKSSHYLRPNRNCNLTSWNSGCEPGWACSVGDNLVRLKDAKEMPPRIVDCQPCCEGFFCPRGLTCMIRKYLQEYLLLSH